MVKNLSLITLSLFIALPVAALETAGPDQAVTAYLRLKSEGQSHRQALASVRRQFAVSDAELEAAADRLAASGVSTESRGRVPATR